MLSEQFDTTNKKVLVIDDDAAMRMMARASLEQYDFQVAEAADGEQGIETFKEVKPDIVLLDVMMPGMDGFEACIALRGLPGGDNVPIIMMTGCDDVESISRAFRAGATEFLTKPINWLTLPYHVRYVVRASRMFDKLQQSEQQNSVILQTLPDHVLYVKKDGAIIRWNKKPEIGAAHSGSGAHSQKIADVFPPNFSQCIMEAIENNLHGKREIIFEYNAGAAEKPSFYEARLVKSGIEEYLVIVRDITTKMTALEETKRTKEFLETVIHNSIDGIAVTDFKGSITTVNPAVLKMFQCNEEYLMGKHFAELLNAKDVQRANIKSKMQELMELGWASYELSIRRDDGTTTEVECNTSLIKDKEGNPVSAVALLRDVTERRKIDAHLLQTEKLRALGELSAGVAHDFNNILAIIVGRCQMLKNNQTHPIADEKRKTMIELKSGLDIIEKAALDGAETVNRIQQFSRKDQDNKNFVTLDINDLLNDVVEYTRTIWDHDAQHKGISVSVHKNFSPIAPVTGHASQLREVFTNLIKNALDAMPDGGSLTMETFMDGNSVVIKVADSGRGIPAEIKERIFDPFFTTKGSQSTGLGLSISYGIISRHYGTITVDSSAGKGTTFSIYLPQALEAKQANAAMKKDEISAPSAPARILIIDDEEEIRGLLQEIVLADGHVADIASDGESGLKKLCGQAYDLVFTDLGMPGLTGWDVAKKVKEINDKIPVALITGYQISDEEENLQEKGVDFILCKPFHITEVQKLVAQGIQLRDRLAYN
jgi:PAS domain S-box-containing protein